MIKNLTIENFALIKNLQLNFKSGFNVFIGETGAGKSIIINSLSFVLGGKVAKTQIRTGENHIIVKAIFENVNVDTKEVLKDLGFSDESDENILILSRRFDLNGKSECRVNGEIVTLSMLKQIAVTLVDSYGQHENQTLLKTSNHILILDSYKPELLKNLKNQISELLLEYKKIKTDLKQIGGSFENRERMLDLINYQINEIEIIDPKINEDEELEAKISEIKNFEKISNSLNNAYGYLDGNFSVSHNLKNAVNTLANISQYNELYDDLKERLNSISYEILDISSNIKDELQNKNFSEKELIALDDRLDKLKLLKKKYGGSIEQVLDFLTNAQEEQNKLINADEQIMILNSKLKELTLKLKSKSLELSNIRKKIAIEIEQKVLQELALIGMKNAKFKIVFLNESSEKNISDDVNSNKNDAGECELKFTANGIDNVEFLFSANPGEGLKSLSKTISGGEMSRFMLALKNIIASTDGVGTLVFDEIDSGISGEIGSAIAERIAHLSKKFQILCITHLPQVSAMADNYFYVYKQTQNNSTETKVNILNEEKIYPYLAQLSGSKDKTEISLAHARELKDRANKFKMTI